MAHIRRLESDLKRRIHSIKSQTLLSYFYETLLKSTTRILSFALQSEQMNEHQVAMSYKALSVFIFDLSLIYKALGIANASFALQMRSLELYCSSFLLLSGHLELSSYFDHHKRKKITKLKTVDANKNLSGFGPLWTIIKDRNFIKEKSIIDQIYKLIDSRNANVLGHGMSFVDTKILEQTKILVEDAISRLESTIPKSMLKWKVLLIEVHTNTNLELSKEFTELFHKYLNIEFNNISS